MGTDFPFSKRLFYTALFGIAWAILYFTAGWFSFGAHVSFLTVFDQLIPVATWSVWIYVSYALVLFTTPLILGNREIFIKTAKSMTLAFSVSIIIFMLFPSLYPRPAIMVNDTSSWLLSMVYSIDPASNTFPSLHVSLSFLIALAMHSYNKIASKALFVWAGMIAISTLLTKQHYIADVLGGLALAFSSYYITFKTRWLDNVPKL